MLLDIKQINMNFQETDQDVVKNTDALKLDPSSRSCNPGNQQRCCRCSDAGGPGPLEESCYHRRGDRDVQTRVQLHGFRCSTEQGQWLQHGGPGDPGGTEEDHGLQLEKMDAEHLLTLRRPQRDEAAQEMLNAGCSTYIYTQNLIWSGETSRVFMDQNPESSAGPITFMTPYPINSINQELCEAPALLSCATGGINDGETLERRRNLLQIQTQTRDPHQREAVGSRLHNYNEHSDSESDSPEKDADLALYPNISNCDQEDREQQEDQVVSGPKETRISYLLDKEDDPSLQREKLQPETETSRNKDHEAPSPWTSSRLQTRNLSEEPGPLRNHQGKKDSISLAIKDIKEAIEEVKTRTVRSPYTADEPNEPVWVMRQDLDQNPECNLEPPPETQPPSNPPSPPGAESSSRLLQDENSELSPSSGKSRTSFPTYVEVPGPCEPEDLIDGVIFAASYLGSTQLLSEKTPSKTTRMMQAQEAVGRIKVLEGESQPTTEVDLFISTLRIKVLNTDSQETMMDHPLQTISYIADIGNTVVLMAHRSLPQRDSQENLEASDTNQDSKRQYKMICHVFESEDAQMIAQSIGQAFSVAYQEFLRANGINPEDLSQKEYSDLMTNQDMYNNDLVHFSKSENCKDVLIEKAKGEILGVVIVESGWGSILPTVIIANMMHAGPAEKSGRLNIGDQIMSINGTSLVGLPLTTCQSIIKDLKNQSRIKMNIVRCSPVTTVLIKRPDLRYQLGFSVQNGIVCSLMRGGIAERGGIRVGHRIIEISSQSVVAMPHEKIVHILSNAVGEIHMKTMPAAMYRLLTAQDQPAYI